MKTKTTFLKKSSQTVMIVAACLQLSQCDSSTDLTVNPNATFNTGPRYDKEVLDANLGETVSMPKFLLSGDKIIIDALTASAALIDGELIDDDLETTVQSSGQVFLGYFRFNYSDRFGSEDNIGFLVRSEDHTISANDIGRSEGEFVDSLIQLRDTSFGSGSLAEALLVDASKISADPNNPGSFLLSFNEAQSKTIQNAIRSLGHEADDYFRVLGDQFYAFEANSTNQLLVDENKITGNVTITRIWRDLVFEFKTEKTLDDLLNGTEGVVAGEYEIVLGGTTIEVTEGTFEIQLSSL